MKRSYITKYIEASDIEVRLWGEKFHIENSGYGKSEFWGTEVDDIGMNYHVIDKIDWDIDDFSHYENKIISKYILANKSSLCEEIGAIMDEEYEEELWGM